MVRRHGNLKEDRDYWLIHVSVTTASSEHFCHICGVEKRFAQNDFNTKCNKANSIFIKCSDEVVVTEKVINQ